MRRLISVVLPVAYVATRLAVQSTGNTAVVAAVDVAFLIGFLYTLSNDVERAVGKLGIHGIYNVMIVSWVAAIPQTVVAVYFASVGKYTAAFLDSMVSTLVDAFFVTALVRFKYLDAIKRDWHLIALWVATTLAFGALIEAPIQLSIPHEPYYWMWFLIGAAALPFLFSRGLPGTIHFDTPTAVNLAISTVLIMYVSWDLGQALVTWHMSETQLGVVAAIVSTLPDLLTAFIIRATLARLIEEYAAAEDAIRTMFAAAIHDQISIPALIILVAPAAVGVFPHWLNIWVSVLKFTLLDKRVFLSLGLPPALITVIYLLLNQ
jgi:hypothetical protein